MKYGEIAKSYEPNKAGSLRPHKKIPDEVKNKPSLDASLIFVWDSFMKLTTERLKDFGEIPYSKIIWYCDRHNINEGEFECLIRAMDRVYLDHQNKKVKNG